MMLLGAAGPGAAGAAGAGFQTNSSPPLCFMSGSLSPENESVKRFSCLTAENGTRREAKSLNVRRLWDSPREMVASSK